MGILSENPFIVTENALESLKECDILIADFHGEATAEKIAFAKYFDKLYIWNTYTCTNSR